MEIGIGDHYEKEKKIVTMQKLSRFIGCLLMILTLSAGVAGAAEEITVPSKPYKIGWSTIYLTPSWMQLTLKSFEGRVNYWKEKGVIGEFTVANANGDTATQINQIENMISEEYDAIIVVVGSETACNPVCEKAVEKGIVVISFNSLPSTDAVQCKLAPSELEYGRTVAKWIVNEMGEKGKIIVANGPAGVAVSEARKTGALEVLGNYPGIEVVADLHSEYNEAPAMDILRPVIQANTDIAGVLALGGGQASAALKLLQEFKRPMIPITGENYNGFMKNWFSEVESGFSSIALCSPNWMAECSIDLSLRALQGFYVPKEIVFESPVFTNANIGEVCPNDEPDDYFPLPKFTWNDIDSVIGPLEKR
jgi:ribose transport system substrate-binding protein